jgi:hypothetical protein
MLYARWLAAEADVPLVVVFNLVPKFLAATIRHFGFMLRGTSYIVVTFQSLCLYDFDQHVYFKAQSNVQSQTHSQHPHIYYIITRSLSASRRVYRSALLTQ